MDKPKSHSKPLSPHRQSKRDRMTRQILLTARQIMREEGVAALSMQELARRMGLRAPSLYNYFDGKMQIYDTLFRLGFTLYIEALNAARSSSTTWQEDIQLNINAYMNFAIQNPELYQLCFERPVPGFVPSQESLEFSFGLLHQQYQRVEQLLPLRETGLTPQKATDLVIAIMHGLTALHLANQPELPVGQGRFGSLIPDVVRFLDRAWSKR